MPVTINESMLGLTCAYVPEHKKEATKAIGVIFTNFICITKTMTKTVNYKTQKWEGCSVRRLLEAQLREELPKQRAA